MGWVLAWLLCQGAVASAAQAGTGVQAAAGGRQLVPLMHGWRFRYTGSAGHAQRLASVALDEHGWSRISVPHTWNHVGSYTRHRPKSANVAQGVGWYRLHLAGAALPRAARLYLQFDAVGAVADVWVNGRHVGHHAGAFARFRIDVTRYLHRHADNLIAVRADNSRPAPGSSTANVIPLSGDFFVHGGIYRGVALIGVGQQHIDLMDFGGPGVYGRTSRVSPRQAQVRVRTRLRNDASRLHENRLVLTIRDAQGQPVATAYREVSLPAHSTQVQRLTLSLPRPHRWDGRRDPYLYRLEAVLQDAGRAVDRVTQPLGIRTVRIDPDKGLFLNGHHLALHGVSRHQDRMGKGWAISAADQRQDMAMIEDIGANAIRFSHYEHAPIWFDLADQAGMLVWSEIPFVNAASLANTPTPAALAANARQQLTELIRQNMNHPSVVVWGLGNETDLLMAFGNLGPRASPVALLEQLQHLAKREDPGRPTTLADCCEDTPVNTVPYLPDLAGISDVIGYNRYYGWYYGKVSDLGPRLDALHEKHPHVPMGVSEFGAGGAVSQHTDNPRGGPVDPSGRPHPEELQSWWHEQAWPQLARRRYLWGTWIWNMFDFASPVRHSGDSTDLNDKGLVTYDRRIKKDAYYYYRAHWSSQPTVHINGRRYVHRAYAVTDIRIYASTPKVNASLNGHALGAAACPQHVCVFRQVRLRPGVNHVRAWAYAGRRKVADQVRWLAPRAAEGLGINVGDLSGFVDKTGFRYGSDNDFHGGTPHRLDAKQLGQWRGEGRALERPGYRQGRFSYSLPLPDGRWQVSLLFVDPRAKATTPWRFDVRANGHTVLAGFNPARAAGGTLRGVTRRFMVRSKGGRLRLDFVPVSGQAVLSAIRVRPAR